MNENDSHTEVSVESTNATESERVESEPIVATRGFDANRKPKEVVWGDGRRPNPDRVCTARKTNGQPCTRIAIAGGNVCPAHGGLAPHIQAKARARLQSAADRMAKELLGIATDDDAPAAVKLAAIRDALDRAGLSAKTAIEVDVTPKGFEQVLDVVLAGGSRAESRSRRGEPDDAEHDWINDELGVIDVDVVADDDIPPARPTTPRPQVAPSPAETTRPGSTGSGLLPFEEALERLHTTAPPPQAPAPRRNGCS
ncbi:MULTISPECIES: hypothetical protein [unclassified Gordonia (in: high G+C Gram-positive bacteria)]|uniref:hypothetical protein n=1 Tax=unclassified Gordonia (in: high G+C Gram-positive bacteria) TaxID=2657482 RepID=UPI0009910395|nr:MULTISPECIES: hypothetical protein [unclassified Gordonia (in: high G+C Gram-positive bacteria)]MCX2756598.1 hypothetical protein [Gordonia sp. 4N]